jgi:hypothetical protein
MSNRFNLSQRRKLAMSIAIGLAAVSALAATGSALAATRLSEHRAISWCADHCDQVVIDWNATAYQVIKAADGYQNPLAASRALAMMHLAMHEAASTRSFSAPAQSRAQKEADAAVAAAHAAHDVLAAIYPKQQDGLLAAALEASLVDAGIGESTVVGAAVGKAAAQQVLSRRTDDGSAASEPYQPGSKPGEYRFTPGFDLLFSPHWRKIKPFALTSPSQFRVPAPPALHSDEYARAYQEVQRVGSDRKDARRTPDETHYAAFWYEFSDIGWNRIARTVARKNKQRLVERARTFAMLNVAMADAYVAGWDSKMHYNLWRPVTAIRLGAEDGNAHTEADAAFTPMLPTPPVQDYPSTHSALGAAAATVLAHAFGRDDVRFSFASSSALPTNPVREFKSFSQAAQENADSRVRAGLHFRFATNEGLKLGRNIGRHVVETFTRPADEQLVQAKLCTTSC